MKADKKNSLELRPIGVIRSKIKERSKAPKQGSEGAPDVWVEVRPFATPALDGVAVGDELILLTWLHRAHRDTLKVHPRSDPKRRLTGVFATRSPDRPNPIGLHQVTVRLNKQEASASRSYRSDRWHASHRHQAGAVRNPKALIDRRDSYATSRVSAPNRYPIENNDSPPIAATRSI
jgi:tRNA-Thr(GGU) m(6)t(6)A37 methyltransferase TsaA